MDDDRKSLMEDPQVAPLYGTRDLSEVLSARGFPLKVHDPRHVYSAIRDELMLDGNARQVLLATKSAHGRTSNSYEKDANQNLSNSPTKRQHERFQ